MLARSRYTGTPGQWWPCPSEVRPCCLGFEEKLRNAVLWPSIEALFRHCRTYEHVAQRFGVSAKELRDAIKARRLASVLARGTREDESPF